MSNTQDTDERPVYEIPAEALLRLGAQFALFLLYRDQHEHRTMQEMTATADYGNLWELLAAGLNGPEEHPQVPLNEIIEWVHKQLQPEPNCRA